MADELVTVPEDLTLIASDDEVRALQVQVTEEFNRVNGSDDVAPETLNYMTRLAEGLERINVEIAAREARAASEAERQSRARAEQRAALEARVKGTPETPAAPTDGPDLNALAETVAKSTAEGMASVLVAAMAERGGGARDTGALERITTRATASLSAARRHAPVPKLPAARQVVTAGVDIPGIARGGELNDLDALVDAFHRRAKGTPVTRDGRGVEQLVATMQNRFEHTVDDRTSPTQVEELFKYLTRGELMNSLVAGGGWCAPSEIRYDFFNVACVDGIVDLPTFGVSRGGIRFPTSASLADAVGSNAFGGFAQTFSNTSDPWLWTELDDAMTVTGSTNKPCMRVPCPTFNEVRLECYGVCLTAGNLTDDAYPELTRNTLRLLMAAHDHAQNARIIATMVALSSVGVTGGGFAELNDVVTQIFSGIALAATDYRAKFGMCMDDVLEVIAPFWLKEVLRAGFLWRSQEYEDTSVSDAEMMRFFADRNVRVQFVGDWQVRGASQFGNATTPMTAWPTSVQLMIYAAGTFIKGNGLTLDLGVVRDSILNAENDFTAAWSEECHLVARVGHESRIYTIAFNVSALTAPAATSAPNL